MLDAPDTAVLAVNLGTPETPTAPAVRPTAARADPATAQQPFGGQVRPGLAARRISVDGAYAPTGAGHAGTAADAQGSPCDALR
ncbi:hypothetical protein G6F61_014917 [Rhizopus arrhizus]|nr:hypothetical protein G6F65_016835 [Rhizopus arrhizus]KAG1339718.1 hypothetical protein G6F61_014917 [Rhizopus arrhizus]